MRIELGLSGLLMAGVAAVGLSAATPAAAEDQLNVVSWGGAYQESQREAFFKPFAKDTSTKITEEEYNGEIAKIRAMVQSNSVTWDVIDIDTQTALAACAEGILETIDWKKLGLDRSKFIGGDLQDCAVPNIVYATVIAYDTTKLNPGPTSIKDLFDLQKFPGKRALQKNPFVNLEWALIADGVPLADVYKVLNTPQRIDVIEKMGHLEREDADALRDSATYYRAIDHGLRVWSGQAAGKLPSSQTQLEVLTDLVHRWTPPHMNDQPLAAKLSQVRKRTRELFDRLFG